MKELLKFLGAFSLVTASLFLCSCYIPYTGKVVDSQSGQPVEGAVIVRSWNRRLATPAGGVTSFIAIKEEKSKQDGSFFVMGLIHFPDIPILSHLFETTAVYKPGYRISQLKEKSLTVQLEKIDTQYTVRKEEIDKIDHQYYIDKWKSNLYNDTISKEIEFIDILKASSNRLNLGYPTSSNEAGVPAGKPIGPASKPMAGVPRRRAQPIVSRLPLVETPASSAPTDNKAPLVTRGAAKAASATTGPAKDPGSFEAIVEQLEDTKKRSGAVHQLAKFRDERAEKLLVEALDDPNHEVRYQAAQGLTNFRDEMAIRALTAHLADPSESVRTLVKKGLGTYSTPEGQKEISALIVDLADHAKQPRASSLLAIIGQPAVDKLIDGLKCSDKETAMRSALILGGIADPNAIEPLINNLSLHDDRAQAAATALKRFNDPRVAKALVDALRYSELSSNIRDGLPRMGALALEHLVVALQDENLVLRRNAALALYSIPDPKSVDALIAALKDEDFWVRKYSATALAQILDPRSVAPLFALFGDRDPEVRITAAKALVNALTLSLQQEIYAMEHNTRSFNGNLDLMKSALKKREPFDSAAIKQLISGLSDPAPYIRWRSAWCLGERRVREAGEALTSLLNDSYGEVRWMAMDALQKIRDERAVNKLQEICRDSDSGMREKAGKALATITDENTCH